VSDVVASVRSVSKTYGARKALDGVNLEFRRGERVALIGPSGSGKSTLLRALTGLIPIDKGGTIDVLGVPVQRDGRVARTVRQARTRIGFVAQQFNLVGRLSLFTNTALGLLGKVDGFTALFGRWSRDDRLRVMEALHRVGVSDYAAQRANTLSGGQQQRGAIARALVQGAELLLADEPVASLDPVSARRVMDLLVELNERDGIGVFVTLHQVDYAIRYCDRVIALQSGRIVYDGPSDRLGRAKLVEIYGPEIEDAFWEGVPA
jgi:phosphonate transport system ATP-binding protein